MLKKFATWFIIFGISFLVSDVFKWTEQGKAFFFIHLGLGIVMIVGLVIALIIAGLATKESEEASTISFVVILLTSITLAITLFATWGATKLFGIDYYVAYQIMTLGQCLCIDNKKKDN